MSLGVKGESQGMEALTLISGICTAQEVVVLSPASVDTALAVVLQGPAEKKGEQRTEQVCLHVTKSHHQSPAGTQHCSALRDPVSEAVVSVEASQETPCVSALQLSAGEKKNW